MLSGLFDGVDGGEDGDEAPLVSLYGCQTSSTGGTNHAHRSECGYAGLLNQGATCYLNSLVQTLFMTPDLRDGLFRLTQEETGFQLTEFETTANDENAAETAGAVSQSDGGDSEVKSTGEHYHGDFIDSWVNQQSGFASDFTGADGGGEEDEGSSSLQEKNEGVLPIDEESLVAMGFSHELIEKARGRKFESADDLVMALFELLEKNGMSVEEGENVSKEDTIKDNERKDDVVSFEDEKRSSIREGDDDQAEKMKVETTDEDEKEKEKEK
eukprot:TRINITY_DN1418_c0_g4_i1.p1 TRINITY_DN1418_c0_g4~~TRINITY_DN1418_c0_g4_i1.p1  ORF type:complete len:270 (-),score=87.19 TRINITY_DN1418_c0_g4_i1:22-831(-)